MHDMNTYLERLFSQPEYSKWYFQKSRFALKILLFILISAIIAYLIAPKLFFQPKRYQEGDIILQNLVIEEDLLIPDPISTRLKREKLLTEQPAVFDFDPTVATKTVQRVAQAFQSARHQHRQIKAAAEADAHQNHALGLAYFQSKSLQQQIQSDIQAYTRYRNLIQLRLESIRNESGHSARDFELKKKLDTDLDIVNQLIDAYEEKLKSLQTELEAFPDRLQKAQDESISLTLSLEMSRQKTDEAFLQDLRLELEEKEKALFAIDYYQTEIEAELINLLSTLLGQMIITDKNIVSSSESNTITVRNLQTGKTNSFQGFSGFQDVRSARTTVMETTKALFPEETSGWKRGLVSLLATKLIQPTTTENKLEFEKQKETLLSSMSPVFYSVKKGEIIARAGDRGTRHQVELINSYYETLTNTNHLPRMIGIGAIVFLSLLLLTLSFRIVGGRLRITFKQLLLIMAAIIITLVLVKGGIFIGDIIETRYADLPRQAYLYMLPIALSAMLVGILINFEVGLLAGLLTSFFASIMMQSSLYYFCFAMLGSLVAALPVTRFESRYSLLRHGLKIASINLPVVVMIYLIEKNRMDSIHWADLGSAVMGGLLAAIIVSILLPFFESVFDITTNLKLLELSNMNHPVLKKLILTAPGTYQHSIVVGNLAESVAAGIDANPLLARVASYYHDIGKTKDAHCFIENQSPHLGNIHDRLDPYESARILIDHPRAGAEIAEKHRLGSAIKDIVQQHHGTRLVQYFLFKAARQLKSASNPQEIDESCFRYPGPKPQTLEAAVVMLADVAEAATRSLDNPTAESIREIVCRTSREILEDGQLDESGMTLQTYHCGVEIIIAGLITIHHHRVKYPTGNHITKTPEDDEPGSI
jgi:cyclic-di-AMP phosphodiesterase PgpH